MKPFQARVKQIDARPPPSSLLSESALFSEESRWLAFLQNSFTQGSSWQVEEGEAGEGVSDRTLQGVVGSGGAMLDR